MGSGCTKGDQQSNSLIPTHAATDRPGQQELPPTVSRVIPRRATEHGTDNQEEFVRELTATIDHLSTEKQSLSKEKHALKEELRKLQEEYVSLKSWMSTELDRLNAIMEQEDHEKQKLLHRLSEVAGTKLVDNNPKVTDLSDDNRATKLAEQYTELYDNEWTDIYSTLTEIHNYSEEEAISKILCLAETIFQRVSNQAAESWSKVNESIYAFLFTHSRTGDTNMKTVQKHLKDLRKRNAKLALPCIREIIDVWFSNDREVKDVYFIVKDSVFFTKCVELFWMMVIQDPPLSLSLQNWRKAGKKYRTDLYRPYTAGGKKIEYVVWPVLYVHKKGPLLCKGIAQGTDSKLTDVRSLKEQQNAVSRPELTAVNALEEMTHYPGTSSVDKDWIKNKYSHQGSSGKTGFRSGQTVHCNAFQTNPDSGGQDNHELSTASTHDQVESLSPSHGQQQNPINAWNVTPHQRQHYQQAAKTWHGTANVDSLESTDGNVTFDPK